MTNLLFAIAFIISLYGVFRIMTPDTGMPGIGDFLNGMFFIFLGITIATSAYFSNGTTSFIKTILSVLAVFFIIIPTLFRIRITIKRKRRRKKARQCRVKNAVNWISYSNENINKNKEYYLAAQATVQGWKRDKLIFSDKIQFHEFYIDKLILFNKKRDVGTTKIIAQDFHTFLFLPIVGKKTSDGWHFHLIEEARINSPLNDLRAFASSRNVNLDEDDLSCIKYLIEPDPCGFKNKNIDDLEKSVIGNFKDENERLKLWQIFLDKSKSMNIKLSERDLKIKREFHERMKSEKLEPIEARVKDNNQDIKKIKQLVKKGATN